MKQGNQRRKDNKEGRSKVTWSGCMPHACQVGKCGHQSQWEKRVVECVQKEKDWIDKYAQVQLVERAGCAPEVNEVPQGSDNGDL